MSLRITLRAWVVAVCLCITATGFHTAGAQAATPDQGLYESCSLSTTTFDTCAARLATIGDAGFKVVVNYAVWDGTVADALRYADVASAHGVQLIWPIDYHFFARSGQPARFARMAAQCGCTEASDVAHFMVSQVAQHPATWGYYVADEPTAEDKDEVNQAVAAIKDVDKRHPVLAVTKFGAELNTFSGSVDALGTDAYPIGLRGGTTAFTSSISSDLKKAAKKGQQSVMVLQAFSWEQYAASADVVDPHWPGRDGLKRQLAAASADSPSLILWYSYQDIAKSADPNARWADLVDAAFGSEPKGPVPTKATKTPIKTPTKSPTKLTKDKVDVTPVGQPTVSTDAGSKTAAPKKSVSAKKIAAPQKQSPPAKSGHKAQQRRAAVRRAHRRASLNS
jgi:hypothetical protein